MNHSQAGLITVQQISRSVLQGSVLNDIIREQLIIIDKKILGLAKQIGENKLTYDLPITFNTAPTNTTDTKIMVYYHIIKNLESRGYTINLDLDNSRARIHIEWIIGLDRSSIENMEQYLQTKTTP